MKLFKEFVHSVLILSVFFVILSIFSHFSSAQITSINNTISNTNDSNLTNTAISNPTLDSSQIRCSNFYWFDDTSSVCGYKQFCGAFMYQTLRTFTTEIECIAALKANNTITEESASSEQNITTTTFTQTSTVTTNGVDTQKTVISTDNNIGINETIDDTNIIPTTQQFEKTTITKPAINPAETQTNTTTKNEPISVDVVETQTKIQDTTESLQAIQTTMEATKEELKKIVDENVKKITDTTTINTDIKEIETIKAGIINNIDTTLSGTKPVPQEKIEALTKDIQTGLNQISETQPTLEIQKENYSNAVEKTFETMSMTIEDQVKNLKDQGGDLLYKDSNNDGISDYDSKYVYNIDPIKPTPTTIYEGKVINAGEKVQLGLDPAEKEIVKIIPEEPIVSEVKPTTFYKVEEVKLTSEKKVVLTGKYLPNSYVTIYVYSTPIIVTVKTDSNGDWSYTLDKELDDGKHTVYTATVNNTGKIIAKSPAYTFVKTAEAATLEPITPVQSTNENIKPGILSGNNLYIFIAIFVPIIIFALVLIGRGVKKENDIQQTQ